MMTVSCPDCRSVFRVDPAKVPATGVRARCSVCGGIIVVHAASGGRATPVVSPRVPTPEQIFATPSEPVSSPTPAAVAATAAVSPTPSPFSAQSASTTAATAATAATPAATSPTTATPRRSINPFLNADPRQRARRLARALVSDLVAYHPRKQEEGLAQGTLRQLFREEIKKSYEEYVDQVGRESAESSPYFQDALNEILASGQQLF